MQNIVFVSRNEVFWNNHPPPWAIVWIAIHNPILAQNKELTFKILTGVIPTLEPGQIRIFEEK